MTTAATLDRPDPAKPAAISPWTVGKITATTGPLGAVVAAEFLLAAPALDVAAAADLLRTRLVREPLAERVAGLPTLRRYGLLRAEAAVAEQDLAVLTATERRTQAQRDECLALAQPGFAGRLADLDGEVADLGRRREQAERRAAAVRVPVEQAGVAAMREIEDARAAVNVAAARAVAVAGDALLAELTVRLGDVLTRAVAVQRVAAEATLCGLGAEVSEDVDRLAAAAA